MAEIVGTITPRGELAGTIAISQGVRYPEYDGPITITPTSEEQTIPTSWRVVTQDLTVAPIPSNYGLISVSGHILTVS